MVANIRSGPSPSGALYYNKEKVDKDDAEVLLWQKMLDPFDKHGRMDVEGLATARSEHLPPPFNQTINGFNQLEKGSRNFQVISMTKYRNWDLIRFF